MLFYLVDGVFGQSCGVMVSLIAPYQVRIHIQVCDLNNQILKHQIVVYILY